MKKNILLFGIVAVVTSIVSANNISIDSLVSYASVGPVSVSHLKVINSAVELNEYCEATDYDVSLLPAQPDFTSKTVVGLVTMAAGGNIINYRTMKRVYVENDSIFLEIKPDSQVLDVGISLQAGSKVLLFAIPKTDKPVVMKMENNTAVEETFHRGTVLCTSQQKLIGLYSLQGRSLSANKGHAYRAVVFSGGQNRGKVKIIEQK
jgi:hypothetical protein